MLHAGAEGDVIKTYAFARKDMSISADLTGLSSTEKLKQQLANRGFHASATYTDFHSWLCDLTGLRSKAMDMFNQTVALKDIRSLNAFIRDHMLEAGKWEERIEQLQHHYQDLTAAHASLVRVQRQAQLLSPIQANGVKYQAIQSSLARLRRTIEALEFYFLVKVVELGNPKMELFAQRKAELSTESEQLSTRQRELDDEIRRLANEIDNAGGQRMRDLPRAIELELERAKRKRETAARVSDYLRTLGLTLSPWDAANWDRLKSGISSLKSSLSTERDHLQQRRDEATGLRADLRGQIREREEELLSLQRRKGNLPRFLDQVRRRLCEDLSLNIDELPFAAELVSVREPERDWQASVEMVLRGYALTMLVPRRHYSLVSRQIEGRRLIDDRGLGVRLQYEVIAEGMRSERRQLLPKSIVMKLEFRQEHPLSAAVRTVIEERFDRRCCDSVEEWHQNNDNAITKNRHERTRQRHKKDDRDQAMNPADFVLGWDNAAKMRAIAAEVVTYNSQIAAADQGLIRDQKSLDGYGIKLAAADSLQATGEFSELDYEFHERRASELQEALRQLQDKDESSRTLKAAKSRAEEDAGQVGRRRDEVMKQIGTFESEARQIATFIDLASGRLREAERDGSLAEHRQSFDVVASHIAVDDLTYERLHFLEGEARRVLTKDNDNAIGHATQVGGDLLRDMAKFLKEFKEEEDDLRVDLEHLDSYLELYRRIADDDLPTFTERFRSRLNDTMLDEIGLLNGDFMSSGNEIKIRIEQLNVALAKLDYRGGTLMRLDCRPSKDAEIIEFKQRVRDCTTNSLERTPEADEERFTTISKLLVKLRDEPSWRQRVTDVRRWFDFVARELRRDDNSEVNFFQDGQGQSGGEKAKLAFTILVAAIAYQYDLDPDRPGPDRFNFIVVDEMFSKVDDQYSKYAMRLFAKFNLQLLVVAPLDAKARVTEEFVGCYLHVIKDADRSMSEIFHMTAAEFSTLSAGEELAPSTPTLQ